MTDYVYLISGLTGLIVLVAVWVWLGFAFSALFRKIGEETWQAWVPIVPFAVLLRRGGFNPWLVLVPVANVVLLVISIHRLNLGFGHGVGMTVFAYFFLPIWATILGFGSARWLGGDGPRRSVGEQFGSHGHQSGAAAGATGSVDAWSFAPPPATAPEPSSAAPSLRSTADPANTVTSSDAPLPPPSWAPSPAGAGYSFPPAASDVAPPPSLPDFPQAPPPIPDVPSAGPVFTAPPAPPVPPAPAVRPAAGYGATPSTPPAPTTNAAPPAVDLSDVPASAQPAEPWMPPMRRTHDDAFAALDSSAEVSAVAGAPQAGAPRSASSSVAAQHKLPEIPNVVAESAQDDDESFDDDVNDETVILARKRAPKYVLTPPAGPPIAVTGDVVILGRRPSADPSFPDAQLVSIVDETRTVSKTHARLELTDRGWILTDLGSTNGVVLFEADGSELEVLADGIGRVVDRFLLGDAEMRLSTSTT